MGTLRAALALLVTDLRRELRTGEALVPMLMFGLVVLVISGFAFNLPEMSPEDRRRLAPGILWIAIAFAMLVGQARLMLADREDERFMGILISPLDRTALFAVKWLEGLLLGAAAEILLVPLSIIFFGFDAGEGAAALLLIVVLGTGALAALGTLLGSLTATLGRGEALLAILVLPVASPVLIAGTMTTSVVLGGGGLAEASPWPMVCGVALVAYMALGAILFESVLVE